MSVLHSGGGSFQIWSRIQSEGQLSPFFAFREWDSESHEAITPPWCLPLPWQCTVLHWGFWTPLRSFVSNCHHFWSYFPFSVCLLSHSHSVSLFVYLSLIHYNPVTQQLGVLWAYNACDFSFNRKCIKASWKTVWLNLMQFSCIWGNGMAAAGKVFCFL